MYEYLTVYCIIFQTLNDNYLLAHNFLCEIFHTVDEVQDHFCWDLILVWVVLRSLQGGGVSGMGVWYTLRVFLWVKVQQYTAKEAELTLFNHLHR